MNSLDPIRGIAKLCHHCVRNLAYYRAGWVNGKFVSDDDFWINANGNFLDIAVLEWCKLFVDRKGEQMGDHHWSQAFSKAGPCSPEALAFLSDMLQSADISDEEFDTCRNTIKTYRNKNVAHQDKVGASNFPELDIAVESTVFLYDRIFDEYGNLLRPNAKPNLRNFYKERLEHGRRQYPNSTW